MKKIIFIIFLGLYLLCVYSKWVDEILPSILQNHLADFLAVPTILLVTEFLMRRFQGKHPQLTPWRSFTALLYLTVVFEGILPMISQKYTSDWLDAVSYTMGWLVWLTIHYIHKKIAATNP